MAEGLSKALTFYEKGAVVVALQGQGRGGSGRGGGFRESHPQGGQGQGPSPSANNSSAPDMAGPAPADMAGAESSGGNDVAERVILAGRTAVRALLAQAGSLKQLGRLPYALEAGS
ncbi:hypothetical protein COCSUDRAFT_61357 [Coccomyxa subellipsoidea C-169]|uniref:Uncharacterized protein n=1 Tax=Coccomyxa subellipsoidea (strain C-169) TaxID=574566 RepID=I0Z398_COCSC|nr:hypothetical protein COCSUDRAFT_61357 [Coccomyxa subellipsoidea C-169]EIE25117.1 hypothetical protein COCSUDRAFT_61357 [Coccomyxa subellipsoidea C-169]|eukprot:XP_005649661.1 hypothetical protein COCSUDRAFT_61357 [Coccomyxa subellipsoidea C-169]